MSGFVLGVALQAAVLVTGAQPYDEAFRKSVDTGRPLLVLVGTDWCPACVSLKHSVLGPMERNGKLQSVEYAVVDADRNLGLARRIMTGESIPQLIAYSKVEGGWRRYSLVGGQSESEVQALIEKARDTASAAVSTARLTSGKGAE